MRRFGLGVSAVALLATITPGWSSDWVTLSHEAVDKTWAGGYAGVSAGLALPRFDNGWCPGNQYDYYLQEGETADDYPGYIVIEDQWNPYIDFDGCRYPSQSQDMPGAMYGAHVGFNMQDGALVYGAEADLHLSNLVNVTPYMENPWNQNDSDVSELSIDALASLRGRIGFAFGDTLLSASAGVGYVQGEFAASTDSTDLLSRVNISEFAPVVGLTVEQRVSEAFSLRAGVSHYFVSGSTNVEELGDGANSNWDGIDFNNLVTWQGVTTVTAGLSFHMK